MAKEVEGGGKRKFVSTTFVEKGIYALTEKHLH